MFRMRNVISPLGFALIWLLLGPTAAFGGGSAEKNQKTSFHFGTPCSITLYGRASDSFFASLFARMDELDGQLSSHNDLSAVSTLNRAAGEGPVAVPDELFHVVKHGIAYSRLSAGAFDITIGPVVALWGITGEEPGVPDQTELEEALALLDYQRVVLFEPGKKVLLERRGMQVDLGGIAKGYAADEIAEIVRKQHFNHGLINFGGNIVAIGSRPDGTPWRIGIQHPERSRGESIGVVEVVDKTVVTSGKYERFFVHDGVRYHHIIDTATGYPVENGIASVTIVTDSSMKADALSTAVFILGMDAGLELVRSFDGVEAIIVTEENAVHLTEGVKDGFSLFDMRFSIVE